MQGFKYWKDWLHPVATVLGAWGGFPQPPKIFLRLSRYELFQWFLVFALAYQGGAEEQIQQALIITVVFYLISKLLDLKEFENTQEPPLPSPQLTMPVIPSVPGSTPQPTQTTQTIQAAAQAAGQATMQATGDQNAAQNAAQTAAATVEKFLGGYYM